VEKSGFGNVVSKNWHLTEMAEENHKKNIPAIVSLRAKIRNRDLPYTNECLAFVNCGLRCDYGIGTWRPVRRKMQVWRTKFLYNLWDPF